MMAKWLDMSDEDERALAAFMARVAVPSGAPALRAPAQLWWKGQLVRRWDAERRAQQPLDAMERVEILAGVAVAGVLLVWAMPSVIRYATEPFLRLLG